MQLVAKSAQRFGQRGKGRWHECFESNEEIGAWVVGDLAIGMHGLGHRQVLLVQISHVLEPWEPGHLHPYHHFLGSRFIRRGASKIKVRSVSSSTVMANGPRAAHAAKERVCFDLFHRPINPDRFITSPFLSFMTLESDPLWNARLA